MVGRAPCQVPHQPRGSSRRCLHISPCSPWLAAGHGPGWPPSQESCGELAVPPGPAGQHLQALLGTGHFIFLS